MIASSEVFDVLSNTPELIAKLNALRGHADPLGGIYIDSPDFGDYTNEQIADLSPWIRITDLPGDAHEQADDNRFLEYPRVQIDFWVRKEQIKQASELDELLRTTMHAARWARTYHDSGIDGDNPKLRMTTAYFQSLGLPV